MVKNQKNPVLDVAKELGPAIREVEVFLCPSCGQEYNEEYEAAECCPPEIESEIRYECPDCKELHGDEDSAFNCCLQDQDKEN